MVALKVEYNYSFERKAHCMVANQLSAMHNDQNNTAVYTKIQKRKPQIRHINTFYILFSFVSLFTVLMNLCHI